MIMMATRGRGGVDRLWLGSVAERVVQQTRLPVFLVPVHEALALEGGVQYDFQQAVEMPA